MFEKLKQRITNCLRNFVKKITKALHKQTRENILTGYSRLGWEEIGEKRKKQIERGGYSTRGHRGMKSPYVTVDENIEERDFTNMADSIESEVSGLKGKVTVKAPYAKYHEFGVREFKMDEKNRRPKQASMPKRPFLVPALIEIRKKAATTLESDLRRAIPRKIRIKMVI